jgi:ArsR family transcriptional regulator
VDENILKAFSNKTRLKIILCLSDGKKNVTDLINSCGLSQSAVSQHLSKLRETGLVYSTKDGKEVYYELTNSRAAEISSDLISFIKEIEEE